MTSLALMFLLTAVNAHGFFRVHADTSQRNLRGLLSDVAPVLSSSPELNFQNVTSGLDLDVFMGPKEKQLLDDILSQGTNYFEFGLGGSTVFASEHVNLQHITAVDSSKAWIAKVESASPIATDIQRGRISIQHVDLGNVNTYGYPLAPVAAQEREYSKTILGAAPVPDVVLVDGRYRVACALRTAIEAVEKDWPGLVLMIHDYERAEYRQYVNALLGPPTREQGDRTPDGHLLAAWDLSAARLQQMRANGALLGRMRAQLQQSETVPQLLNASAAPPNASASAP